MNDKVKCTPQIVLCRGRNDKIVELQDRMLFCPLQYSTVF